MTDKNDKFAVIKTGGKQYVVRENDTVKVEKLPETEGGSKIIFDEILLITDGSDVKIGDPVLKGAKVEAELIKTDRAKKVSVIRFRAKSRYFKNKGHRQPFSEVKITKI